MPAPGQNGSNYQRRRRRRLGKPLLGADFTSPKSEALAMAQLLEHHHTVEQVRELIRLPAEVRRELRALGVPSRLIRRCVEFRERVLTLFENMHEKKENKARRALRKVQFGLDADVAHVAPVERFCSQSSTA